MSKNPIDGIKIMMKLDAKWMALNGHIIIVGHGEIVSDNGEVIPVVLVKDKVK